MEKSKINNIIKLIAKLSIDKSSQSLSKMIKSGAKIDLEDAYSADISKISAKVSDNEEEVVGTIVKLEGDASFNLLFIVRVADSLILTDMILRREVGTTKEFDIYAQSAVQEIGNIMANSVANVFSVDFQIGIQTTPPILVHDYIGTIFSEYIMETATTQDEIMIMESKFKIIQHDIKCQMFVLPTDGSEKVLAYLAN